MLKGGIPGPVYYLPHIIAMILRGRDCWVAADRMWWARAPKVGMSPNLHVPALMEHRLGPTLSTMSPSRFASDPCNNVPECTVGPLEGPRIVLPVKLVDAR